jgi:ABC-type branched-subunit amino acid transport system ATPase component
MRQGMQMPQPEMPVLACTDVAKNFGGVHALKGVSLSVSAGEIVGLIGPNGSGKSTLLDCLGGATIPSSGHIELGGRDVTGTKPFRLSRLGLARTFQQNRIFRNMTVIDNVLAACDWKDVGLIQYMRKPKPELHERAAWLLENAGLQDHLEVLAENLSGGQRRLLEIAMSLMPSPRVILLDEATSGVNPMMIDSFVQYIRMINESENCAFLVVEHNLQFISDLATRIVALDQGQILVEGSPDIVMHDARLIEAYLGA